jgi:S1-C subfamily serine protease
MHDKVRWIAGACAASFALVLIAAGAVRAQNGAQPPAAPAPPATPQQVPLAPPAEQPPSAQELLSGVLRIKTFINPDARSIQTLGRERTGSGIVIDHKGLILTIGYLMLEAYAAQVETIDGKTVPAEIVGYDHESGFGLLRASAPLNVRPLALGKSSDLKVGEKVLAASFGGRDGLAPAVIISLREFAGGWEYLIGGAIFTAPAHNEWSGAALINREGKLVGVGSLIVSDATGKGERMPGNMYVPIDLLTPVLGDLIDKGRLTGKIKPWLGITTEEIRGRLFVVRVAPDSPAQKAGIKRGDIILGVNGAVPQGLADFYRKVWALGPAGVTVPLEVLQDTDKRRVDIKSMDRSDHLKLKSTF